MTYVVNESCIRCKYTDCVEVCPVDCFYEGPNFLVINPDECIDCAVCVAECPVNAIYAEEDVPADQQHMIKLNADLAQVAQGSGQQRFAAVDPPGKRDEHVVHQKTNRPALRERVGDQLGPGLAGARDPLVGKSLALLHRRPSHPWTIAELAAEVWISTPAAEERVANLPGPLRKAGDRISVVLALEPGDGVVALRARALRRHHH